MQLKAFQMTKNKVIFTDFSAKEDYLKINEDFMSKCLIDTTGCAFICAKEKIKEFFHSSQLSSNHK